MPKFAPGVRSVRVPNTVVEAEIEVRRTPRVEALRDRITTHWEPEPKNVAAKLAKTTLEEILAADDRVLKDPAPTVAVAELADSSVNFVVRPWVNTSDYWAVRFDLTEQIKLTFDEKGISIPYPQMDVHLPSQAA